MLKELNLPEKKQPGRGLLEDGTSVLLPVQPVTHMDAKVTTSTSTF